MTRSAMPELETNRRPIASRSAEWAKASAAFLARTSVTRNQISAVSVLFAAVGAALVAFKPDAIGLIGCAAAVQARLVCNLLDGMVAIEGGKKSSVGRYTTSFPTVSPILCSSSPWAMLSAGRRSAGSARWPRR
jgi:CDP-diacylglycerol--glycerol-3-phosphate 3-phosphatidyltransferase